MCLVSFWGLLFLLWVFCMVKGISCRMVSSVFGGQHRQGNGSSWPPAMANEYSELLIEIHGDDGQECFPMGMFVDVIIGD